MYYRQVQKWGKRQSQVMMIVRLRPVVAQSDCWTVNSHHNLSKWLMLPIFPIPKPKYPIIPTKSKRVNLTHWYHHLQSRLTCTTNVTKNTAMSSPSKSPLKKAKWIVRDGKLVKCGDDDDDNDDNIGMNDSKKKIRSKDGSTSTHKTKTKKPSMEESASSLVLVSTKSTHTTTSRSRSSKTKLNALSPKKSTMTAPTFIIVNGKLVKQQLPLLQRQQSMVRKKRNRHNSTNIYLAVVLSCIEQSPNNYWPPNTVTLVCLQRVTFIHHQIETSKSTNWAGLPTTAHIMELVK